MSFDKDDQLERDGFYGSDRPSCHLCAARFHDDNHMAEHMIRHRMMARGHGSTNDRLTNERQATRGQVDELREMLEELRAD